MQFFQFFSATKTCPSNNILLESHQNFKDRFILLYNEVKTVNFDEVNLFNEIFIELQNNANKICLW